MRKIRQIHLYLGVLFAPSILFFALTGAFQTFRWQENGAAGAATQVLSQMAAIHKNSALERAEPRRRPSNEAAPPRREEPEGDGEAQNERRGLSPLPLKIYVFLMSLGLVASTGTGVAMAFKPNRERRLMWALLLAGTLLPLVLLWV